MAKHDEELVYECHKCPNKETSLNTRPCIPRLPLMWDSGLTIPSRCIFGCGEKVAVRAEWKFVKSIDHKYGWATKKERMW